MQRVQALPAWQRIDFISDLHLQADDPATAHAWRHYMTRCDADALFILGDCFEVWVGDDVLDTTDDSPTHQFARVCAHTLAQTTQRLPVFVMHGNRDFLIGSHFAQHTGVTLLDDPCLLSFGSQCITLTHGDAWCLDDTDYQAFRGVSRTTAWQTQFLQQPLATREAMAQGMREQSNTHKASVMAQGHAFADVDAPTALHWMAPHNSHVLIHGHTHQPADHALGPAARRLVLSDWDASSMPPRLEVLSIDAQGTWQRRQAERPEQRD